MNQELLLKITLTNQILSSMIQAGLDTVIEKQDEYIKSAAEMAEKVYNLYAGV